MQWSGSFKEQVAQMIKSECQACESRLGRSLDPFQALVRGFSINSTSEEATKLKAADAKLAETADMETEILTAVGLDQAAVTAVVGVAHAARDEAMAKTVLWGVNLMMGTKVIHHPTKGKEARQRLRMIFEANLQKDEAKAQRGAHKLLTGRHIVQNGLGPGSFKLTCEYFIEELNLSTCFRIVFRYPKGSRHDRSRALRQPLVALGLG